MKCMNKYLLLILSLCLCLCLPLTASAEEFEASGTWGNEENGGTWTLGYDGALNIYGTGALTSGIFNNYPGDNACDRSSVIRMVVHEGITEIPANVFYVYQYSLGMPNLTSVSLPSTLKSIGSMAFRETALREIVIPDGVTSIGDNVFWNCNKLRNVTLPASLTELGYSVFSGCEALKQIVIPEGVTSLGDYMFERCTSLTSVTLPAYMESIGQCAFNNCTSLKSIVIPEGVEIIQYATFSSCDALQSVVIPGSVTTIEEYAFQCCESLTEVVIPEGVTSIANNVFQYCYGLRSIELPDTLQSIGYQAFDSCTSLTEISLPDSVSSIGNSVFSGCSVLAKVKLPASLKKIPDSLFYMNTVLREVVLPEGVVAIGDSTFSGCYALAEIVLPDSLKVLGAQSFAGCSNLQSIIIPEGVNTLPAHVFNSCSSLKNVELPSSLDDIEYGAFMGCSSLESIVIPEGVYSLEEAVFSGCDALVNVDLPDSLEQMGKECFAGCDGLKEIEIPTGLEIIPEAAFQNCSGLENVILHGTLKKIEQNAFRNSGLKSLTIPEGVEHITYSVFRQCYNLETVVIADSVVELNGGTFQDCTRLKTVKLSSSLTTISDSLFKNCSSLEELSIPEGVTTIESNAFRDCSSLRMLQLPTTLVSLGGGMIAGCGELEELTVYPAAVAMNTMHEWVGDGFGSGMHYWFDPFCKAGDPNYEYEYTVKLNVYPDSYALTYAQQHGISYELVVGEVHRHEYTSVVTTDATCIEDGYTSYTCTLCGYIFIDDYIPALGHKFEGNLCTRCDHLEILEGEVVIRLLGDMEDLSIRINAEPDTLLDVYLNGELVDPSNYIVTRGSTIITFSPEYLDTLPAGDYEVTAKFESGDAVSKLWVFGNPIVHLDKTGSYTSNDGNVYSYICPEDGQFTFTIDDGDYWAYTLFVDKEYMGGSFAWDSQPVNSYSMNVRAGSEVRMLVNYLYEYDWDLWRELLADVDFTISFERAEHNYESVITAPTYTEQGYTTHTCTECGNSYVDSYVDPLPLPKAKIEVARMILGNELAMQFAFPKADIAEGVEYVVSVTKTYADGREDKNILVSMDQWGTSGSYYYVSFNGIAAKEMGDTINVQILTADGTAVGDVYTDSVKAYAVRQLRKATEAEIRTLYVDMLNYGAAAQTYFKYDAENLVTDELTETEKGYGTKEVKLENNLVKGTGYVASQLDLGSSILLRVKFNGIDSSMYAIVKFTNHNGREIEERIEGSEFISGGTVVVIDDVVAADYDRDVTITVYDADGKEVANAVESVASYLARQLEKPNSLAIYDAVAKYCAAAYGYLHK